MWDLDGDRKPVPFPFQPPVLRVRPQCHPSPCPLRSVLPPPSLPGSCFAPKAWLVSTRAWGPLSSGEASHPDVGHGRAPGIEAQTCPCSSWSIQSISMLQTLSSLGQGCTERVAGRQLLGPVSSDQAHRMTG